MPFTKGHKINVGRKFSLERNLKISKSRKARFKKLGYLNSSETRLKISLANKGRIAYNKGIPGKYVEGKARQWKGDDAGLTAKHRWVEKKLGKPNYCEVCKRTDKKIYHWANKYHTYKRRIEDWQRLCISCHRTWDYKYNNYPIYGKTFKENNHEAKKIYGDLPGGYPDGSYEDMVYDQMKDDKAELSKIPF